MLEIPAVELHQRQYTNGITAYAFDLIASTIAAANAVEQEYTALEDRALALAEPYDTGMGTHKFAPKAIINLLNLLEKDAPAGFSEGNIKRGGKQEKYPVATWQKQIASYRNAIRKIQNAIKACEQAAHSA